MSINGRQMYEVNFRRHLPGEKQAPILDIGCGFGEFLEYLEEGGHSNLMGIEIDAVRAEASRQRSSAQIITTTDLEECLRSLPQRYDLITLKSVISHFPRNKVLDYLRAIRGCLTADGRLVVETFNASRWTGCYLLYNDITHHWAYTEYSLREVLETAGLRVVKLTGEKIPLCNPKRIAWYALQQIWVGCLKLIYLAECGISCNPRIFSKYLIAVCQRGPSISK